MKILIFGATGMIGQGVLRECLLDPNVELVETVGRTATGARPPKLQEAKSREPNLQEPELREPRLQQAKLKEIIHQDMWNYQAIEASLAGFDACFFCLGVASAGMTEKDYERVTYGITLAAAEALCRLNPQMTFVYVSGAGTDSTEQGRTMWARIKGKTENALLRLPFRAAYMFRPGFIQPLHGERSKTLLYRVFYVPAKPLMPLLRRAFPNQILTTVQIGRAMLAVGRQGYPKRVLEIKDIRAAAV